jgi:Holliday junction resolvasome RuvABC DNA-binding subunit
VRSVSRARYPYKSYFEEVQKDELAELKEQLLALGFSRRAIATAYKNVQEKGE